MNEHYLTQFFYIDSIFSLDFYFIDVLIIYIPNSIYSTLYTLKYYELVIRTSHIQRY